MSRVEQASQGTGKTLTEKNLAGWRKANGADYSVADAPAQTTREALRQRLTNEFGADVIDALEKAGLLRIADAPPSSMLSDAAGVTEGERIGLFAGNTPVGRRTLALVSMRRYPGATDFETIRDRVVPSYAPSDAGDVRIV